MRAVITVVGKDKTGIIGEVSSLLAQQNANIQDISQTIMQEYFVMIMLVDIGASQKNIEQLSRMLEELAKRIAVDIRIMHEDIFNTMHRI